MPCSCSHEVPHAQLVTAHGHLADQHRHHELTADSTLHVVGVVSNPRRWQSRYRLAREWLARMEATPHVRAYLVETTFGDRQPELEFHSEPCHPRYLRLKTGSEIWIKEAMINLGVQRLVLPTDAKYLCWSDTDIEFREPGWALETIHQLQHYAAVQPFQQIQDLGPDGDVMKTFNSFGLGFQKVRGDVAQLRASSKDRYVEYAHPGYAWACTRDFWAKTQGLVDWAILGSGDFHMAWAMAGHVERATPDVATPGYAARLRAWQARALHATGGQVGVTKGRIEHFFHGAKVNRQYKSRWDILDRWKYDPDTDLTYDAQGLVQLVGNKPGLEFDIRRYNEARSEDSIDRG